MEIEKFITLEGIIRASSGIKPDNLSDSEKTAVMDECYEHIKSCWNSFPLEKQAALGAAWILFYISAALQLGKFYPREIIDDVTYNTNVIAKLIPILKDRNNAN